MFGHYSKLSRFAPGTAAQLLEERKMIFVDDIK